MIWDRERALDECQDMLDADDIVCPCGNVLLPDDPCCVLCGSVEAVEVD